MVIFTKQYDDEYHLTVPKNYSVLEIINHDEEEMKCELIITREATSRDEKTIKLEHGETHDEGINIQGNSYVEARVRWGKEKRWNKFKIKIRPSATASLNYSKDTQLSSLLLQLHQHTLE